MDLFMCAACRRLFVIGDDHIASILGTTHAHASFKTEPNECRGELVYASYAARSAYRIGGGDALREVVDVHHVNSSTFWHARSDA